MQYVKEKKITIAIRLFPIQKTILTEQSENSYQYLHWLSFAAILH